ncbi:diaminobutyrate acetyltransferase [Salininema proteolyticum]|uniref:L-2,4-diaminobutyric acid acetyltransferase n=1 Tax=Salininema proteolyticum TaxID=1607685 RepID=A0ABV8TV05_9ACTN
MPRGDDTSKDPDKPTLPDYQFGAPDPREGKALYDLTVNTGNLDVNSPYAYALWCRDFAATSIVARKGDDLAGSITGYLRPDDPRTLFVWQVAVSPAHRRQGLARRMLDNLVDRLRPEGVDWVETTVTPDNKASLRLFASFAEGRNVKIKQDVLFTEQDLGPGHEPEVLHTIGPLPYRETQK